MASYYNTTRGPLSFMLRSGKVGTAAPKKWTEIADDEESSADIVKLVERKYLVRKASPVVVEVVPAALTPTVVTGVVAEALTSSVETGTVLTSEPVPEAPFVVQVGEEDESKDDSAPLSRKAAKRAARAAQAENVTPSADSVAVVAESDEKGESITDA